VLPDKIKKAGGTNLRPKLIIVADYCVSVCFPEYARDAPLGVTEFVFPEELTPLEVPTPVEEVPPVLVPLGSSFPDRVPKF
jgi:hypothetical protein